VAEYVYEGVGNDVTGDGTQFSPWGTVAKALQHAAVDEPIYLKSKYIGSKLPNLGVNEWYQCWFVDPVNGTDDIGNDYGVHNGVYALATLQYALDNVGEKSWIFCKGTETVAVTIDVDVGVTTAGTWKIVEGYQSVPRDGGYYNIDGAGGAGTIFQWGSTGDGVVLANIKLYGGSGHGLHFGSPGPSDGSLCWNVWSSAPGNRRAFYSANSSNAVVLLFCKATDAQYGYYAYAAQMICHACVADGTYYGFYSNSGLVTHRCVADGCGGDGFQASGSMVSIRDLAYNCGVGLRSSSLLTAIGSVAKDSGGYDFAGGGSDRLVLINTAAHGGSSGQYESLSKHHAMFDADPQLNDPTNDDFRLKPMSPYFNGGESGLHCLTDLAPVGHVLGPYEPRIVHPRAARLAAAGNPHGMAIL